MPLSQGLPASSREHDAALLTQFLFTALGLHDGGVYLQPRDAYDLVLPRRRPARAFAALPRPGRSMASGTAPHIAVTCSQRPSAGPLGRPCGHCLGATQLALGTAPASTGPSSSKSPSTGPPADQFFSSKAIPGRAADGVYTHECPADAKAGVGVMGAYSLLLSGDDETLWCHLAHKGRVCALGSWVWAEGYAGAWAVWGGGDGDNRTYRQSRSSGSFRCVYPMHSRRRSVVFRRGVRFVDVDVW